MLERDDFCPRTFEKDTNKALGPQNRSRPAAVRVAERPRVLAGG
jgi:hypothetical protein